MAKSKQKPIPDIGMDDSENAKYARTRAWKWSDSGHENWIRHLLERINAKYFPIYDCVQRGERMPGGRISPDATPFIPAYDLTRISSIENLAVSATGDYLVAHHHCRYTEERLAGWCRLLEMLPIGSVHVDGPKARCWIDICRVNSKWLLEFSIVAKRPGIAEALNRLPKLIRLSGSQSSCVVEEVKPSLFSVECDDPGIRIRHFARKSRMSSEFVEAEGLIDGSLGEDDPGDSSIRVEASWFDNAKAVETCAKGVAAEFYDRVDRLEGGVRLPLDQVESLRHECNKMTTGWECFLYPRYRSDYRGGQVVKVFNPIKQPKKVRKGDPLRYPLLCGAGILVSVVYNHKAAFLEFTSGSTKVLETCMEQTGTKCVVWEGPAHLRWDGNGSY
ncbi:MAG: hypothetical protein ACKVII_14155 [Planctomycetales bacterium]